MRSQQEESWDFDSVEAPQQHGSGQGPERYEGAESQQVGHWLSPVQQEARSHYLGLGIPEVGVQGSRDWHIAA